MIQIFEKAEVLPFRLLIPNIVAQLMASIFGTIVAQIIRQDSRVPGVISIPEELR